MAQGLLRFERQYWKGQDAQGAAHLMQGRRKDLRLALGIGRHRATSPTHFAKDPSAITCPVIMNDVHEIDLNDADGAAHGAGALDVPDPLRRRTARQGPDGKTLEVLAARRGVTMRGDAAGVGGTGGGDSVLGFIVTFLFELLATLALSIVIDAAAEGRPWKVKAYRLHGPFPRRIYSERLPAGVEPEDRMAQLLDQLAPWTTPDL